MSDISVTVTNAGASTVAVSGGSTVSPTVGNGGSVSIGLGNVTTGSATVVSGTIEIGTVTTLSPGSAATAKNVGTAYSAIIDLGIPQGATGAAGSAGAAGPANSLSIGTVTSGETASATITGTAPSQTLNLVLPQGPAGSNGTSPTLSNATPSALGSASAGTSTSASRSDHVHAMPTAKDLGLATVATSGSYADLTGTPAAYTLPTASPSTLGGVKVGSGLTIISGVLSATEGISWAGVPASSSASGTAGEMAYDSAYLYVAVATNTWKRAALSTWTAGGGGGYGGSFTPTAVILTSGTSYTVPAGATSMKAWAVGPGAPYDSGAPYPGRAGGVAYKTWTVSGGQTITYAIGQPGYPDYPSYYLGSSSSVTVSGQTITARAGDWSPAYAVPDGDGGADGSLANGGRGGPIGTGTFPAGTCRASAGDVSGLLAAVALAGGKATEDCGAQPAFGSGGTSTLSPGRGGGAGEFGGLPPSGAVVLYFT